jgi:cleavage and polyadenylation specificity factor subunit 1
MHLPNHARIICDTCSDKLVEIMLNVSMPFEPLGLIYSYLPVQQSADIEGDLPFAKRVKRIPSDVFQDVTSVEELSFHNNTVPDSLDSAQV